MAMASMFFFLLLNKLYNSIDHELEYIQDTLENVERMIFQGKRKTNGQRTFFRRERFVEC